MAVVIAERASYEYGELKAKAFSILARLDGGHREGRGLIREGSRVLIKPNLLAPEGPGRAITTHPLLVRAAVEYVLSKGGRPQVSDSPPIASFEKIFASCGLKDALRGLPVEVREFRESRTVSMRDDKFRSLELAADALDADVIINLPKLKTHVQMGLTLAVKNLFGCVVGLKKPEWHFRLGEDRELFAELLLSIYTSLRPKINLIDGILAMEGDGPGTGGTPRHIGALIGGDDALSLDIAVCGMLGVEPGSIPTIRAARRLGLIRDFNVFGELPSVEGFVMPAQTGLVFGPKLSRKFLRRHLTSRPVSEKDLCRLCNECVKMCPAKAIKVSDRKLKLDYDACIRCYCCLEICPHGAMKKHEPAAKKAMEKLYGLRRKLI